MSSPLSSTSRHAAPDQARRRAMAAPGTNRANFHCDRSAFSRLAKRMSLAKTARCDTGARGSTQSTRRRAAQRTSMSATRQAGLAGGMLVVARARTKCSASGRSPHAL